MRRIFLIFLLTVAIVDRAVAQPVSRPKLVVGLVVDQMRWDFLYRYQNRYSANGFNRLLNSGFSCENAHIPYVPTYTAPGHACVYTGSVPALHGIIGNNWFDKTTGRNVYCTDDSSVQTVGSASIAGRMSPKNMWANTVTDELRLASNFKSKTIGIALKDRGAILPAGHSATAAYWFDDATGGWISSTYYGASLPTWVTAFNNRKLPDAALKEGWQTLYPLNTYTQSTADVKPYESNLPGEDNAFLHQTDTIRNNRYLSFRYLPAANTYTFDMGRAAIEAEELGSRGTTDFLALSFSATDYIGHAFGPNSVEIEDTYLRFDKDLSQFLNYLDGKVGKGQYLVFLTADHGVAHIPAFANENKLPGGVVDIPRFRASLDAALQKTFGITGIITNISNDQIYLSDEAITKSNLNRNTVKQSLINILLARPDISLAVDLEQPQTWVLAPNISRAFYNGYNQKLSGVIQFAYKPQWFDGFSPRGTTHGAPFPYDTHIPMVWFGWNIKPGKLYREVYMTDIAPTVAALLKIQMPNAAVGVPVPEVIGVR